MISISDKCEECGCDLMGIYKAAKKCIDCLIKEIKSGPKDETS